MKIYASHPSAYSRKVRVLALELGLPAIEFIDQAPRDNATGFFTLNPLARIPVLVTDKDTLLYDSPVICDYLNALAGGSELIPAGGAARWDALRRQALGDGVLDVGLPLRYDTMLPKPQQNQDNMERYRATMNRTMDALEREPATASGVFDIGAISIACMLGWIDFRFPDWGWKSTRPALAAWHAAMEARPSFVQTRPA